MKLILTVLAVSLAGVALAKASNPDESFFENAAQAGMSEVEDGQLAQAKGSSQAVKDFGAMMVKDHSAANEKLKKIAASKGVKLPEGPSLMQKAMHKKLDMKSGTSFDKDYIEGQVKAHEDTAELLRKEIAEGKDAEAKAFASEVLPKVESHLKMIRQIAADAGVKK